MIDDEQVWQQREITGTPGYACENCGRPIGANARHRDDDTSDDGGAGMRICADCLDAMERGVEPVVLDDELEDLDLVR